MLKKTALCAFALVLCVSLFACGEQANKYKLSYSQGGSEKIDYIYFEEEFAVYVVGGIMTVELDEKTILLEQALTENRLTIADILASAEKDASNDKLEKVEYPDGSVQYNYGGFTMVKLNTYTGLRDVYFMPAGKGYYDIVK